MFSACERWGGNAAGKEARVPALLEGYGEHAKLDLMLRTITADSHGAHLASLVSTLFVRELEWLGDLHDFELAGRVFELLGNVHRVFIADIEMSDETVLVTQEAGLDLESITKPFNVLAKSFSSVPHVRELCYAVRPKSEFSLHCSTDPTPSLRQIYPQLRRLLAPPKAVARHILPLLRYPLDDKDHVVLDLCIRPNVAVSMGEARRGAPQAVATAEHDLPNNLASDRDQFKGFCGVVV